MTEKQKTCLTEKEVENLIHEITKLFDKGKYNTSKEDYPDSDAEQSYFAMKELVKETEKAIMKKAVPKEEYDKLKEQKLAILTVLDDISVNSIPKEKVRKAFEGLELAGTVGWLKNKLLGEK